MYIWIDDYTYDQLLTLADRIGVVPGYIVQKCVEYLTEKSDLLAEELQKGGDCE